MKETASVGMPTIPWRRSLAWLLFLGPFFFLSYGFANRMAEHRAITDSLVFGWERGIPFLPWTILPYWSIDLFYGLSFLCCRNYLQVDRHALRLLTAQLICVLFFLLFPLHFAFERPLTDGLFGAMFEALMGFDQPYNQAPSLHIALLVILWVRFATALPATWHGLVHVWSVLIGVSVLTTFQHHFVDIPTGAAVGLLCLWLWPDEGASPLAAWGESGAGRRRQLALAYAVAALLLALVALYFGGTALWLCWGASALAMVAWFYAGLGAAAFQKQGGKHSLAVTILLAPYIAGAWLNSRWWTRHRPQPDAILDDVWLGRLPTRGEMAGHGFAALCDLSAELPAPSGNWHYAGLPWLDLVPPDAGQLAEAARHIEALRGHGPLLVCCALGYSRSACAVAAWLLLSARVDSVDAALALLREKRPQVVLGPEHRAALAALSGGTDE